MPHFLSGGRVLAAPWEKRWWVLMGYVITTQSTRLDDGTTMATLHMSWFGVLTFWLARSLHVIKGLTPNYDSSRSMSLEKNVYTYTYIHIYAVPQWLMILLVQSAEWKGLSFLVYPLPFDWVTWLGFCFSPHFALGTIWCWEWSVQPLSRPTWLRVSDWSLGCRRAKGLGETWSSNWSFSAICEPCCFRVTLVVEMGLVITRYGL